MISVSPAFTKAESADVNALAAQVQLVLGNYANATAYGASAAASSSDASGDYPASGAIDGDRTEINVGPASGADNDVGRSSWRSSVAPDTTPQTLTINLGSVRKLTRAKLYHLTSHGLKTFKLSYSVLGSVYTDFAATADIVGGGQVSINSLGTVDTVDFAEITCQYIKLTINATTVALDMANVVELELYRVIDISSRIKSIRISSDRDFKFQNPIASTLSLVGVNTDRFFSVNHVPTAAEVTAGFVNTELKPSVTIVVKMGFDFIGTQELVPIFTGSIDSITPSSGTREAKIECRDPFKSALKTIVSTKLKTSADITSNQRFMLNLMNVSNHEMSLDSTGIVLDYFYTSKQSVFTTLRDLTQSCGDATLYFDETGKAIGRMYLNSIPLQKVISLAADFDANSPVKTNVTTVGDVLQRAWFMLDDFGDGDYTSNPSWGVGTGNRPSTPPFPPNQWSIAANALVYTNTDPALYEGYASFNFGQMTGTWRGLIKMSAPGAGQTSTMKFWIIAQNRWSGAGPAGQLSKGYFLKVDFTGTAGAGTGAISLCSNDGSSDTVLASGPSFAGTNLTAGILIRITRDADGTLNLYDGSGLLLTSSADTSITTSGYSGFHFVSTVAAMTLTVDDLFFSPVSDGTGTINYVSSVYESGAIDQGAGITSEGIFSATHIIPSGCSLAYYTATSADNISYDGYLGAAPGLAIASTPRRYIKVKVILGCPQDSAGNNANVNGPSVYDFTVNWVTGTGSAKYPSSVTHAFSYDGSLLDLEQQLSDTLAGDAAIINKAVVTARPIVLAGADSDVQWQGTVQTPPVAVSGSASIAVTNGQVLTYELDLPNAMDTSRMSGANPAAGIVTFAATATGTWKFTRIHPTKPVLEITITHDGTITALQVQGKAFATSAYGSAQTSTDAASIAKYGESDYPLSSPWIISNSIAKTIADRLILNYKNPPVLIPRCVVRLTPSIQKGDRITLIDSSLDFSADYIVTGFDHSLTVQEKSANASTALRLLAVV